MFLYTGPAAGASGGSGACWNVQFYRPDWYTV